MHADVLRMPAYAHADTHSHASAPRGRPSISVRSRSEAAACGKSIQFVAQCTHTHWEFTPKHTDTHNQYAHNANGGNGSRLTAMWRNHALLLYSISSQILMSHLTRCCMLDVTPSTPKPARLNSLDFMAASQDWRLGCQLSSACSGAQWLEGVGHHHIRHAGGD